jgi:biopolymer transport protein ExbB
MRKSLTNGFLFLFFSLLSLPVAAQETATTKSSLMIFIERGGPVMYVLLCLSFISFCLVFYYFLSLRVAVIAPPMFIQQAETALAQKDFEMLSGVCMDNDSPASKIISAGTDIFIKSKNNYAMIRDAVEDEGARQASQLWHKIQPLQDIAVVAPMVGLLGTVIGMINSFMSLTEELGTPRPTVIASGVSMALITTAAGLIIGITAMILYSFFRSRINKILTALENSCNKITVEMMVTDNKTEVPF